MYQADGRLAEAVTLLEAVVAERERVLGPSHPDGLSSRHNLGAAYLDAGRLDEALPLFEQAVAGLETALGAEHPTTVKARRDFDSAREQARRPGPGTA